jgi:hypothetical protein
MGFPPPSCVGYILSPSLGRRGGHGSRHHPKRLDSPRPYWPKSEAPDRTGCCRFVQNGIIITESILANVPSKPTGAFSVETMPTHWLAFFYPLHSCMVYQHHHLDQNWAATNERDPPVEMGSTTGRIHLTIPPPSSFVPWLEEKLRRLLTSPISSYVVNSEDDR